MVDYLFSSLTTIEGRYPGCGILLAGDFNRLKISRLLTQFNLTQLVRVLTRGDQTLDLIITNMPHLYNKDLVQTFSPFGLSDYFVILLEPNLRSTRNTSSRRSLWLWVSAEFKDLIKSRQKAFAQGDTIKVFQTSL